MNFNLYIRVIQLFKSKSQYHKIMVPAFGGYLFSVWFIMGWR